MEKGTVIACLAIAGYLAFEVYGVHTQRHLMQPGYIHAQYAGAQRAMARCGDPSPEQRARFERNLAVMARRARQALAEALPGAGSDELDARVAERAAQRVAEVDARVASTGCDDRALWSLMKTYEQRARLNLH